MMMIQKWLFILRQNSLPSNIKNPTNPISKFSNFATEWESNWHVPEQSPLIATKILSTYCKKGFLYEARRVFDEMPERDVVSWTAMINGYASHGHHRHAWMIFCEMRREGAEPNSFTLSSTLKACSGLESKLKGAMVHGCAIKYGMDACLYVENALLDMYAKCSSMDDAYMVFDSIDEKTEVSWTTMIAGYARRGEGEAGIQFFRRMLQENVKLDHFSCSIAIGACGSLRLPLYGKQIHGALIKSGFESSIQVGNSLLGMYVKCMSLSEAQALFNRMPRRDLISWNTMIAGFERCSLQSLHLVSQMGLEDFKPDCFTFTSIAATCANLTVLGCGQQVHGQSILRGLDQHLALVNSLIDMYAKCGSITESRRLFDEMPQRDLVSWTSMIIGYGKHGFGKEAIQLFDQMVSSGIQPDHIVFLGVLSACSHAGLVDEGLKYFTSMRVDYYLLPDKEHYGCIVYLLGRAGKLSEAFDLIQNMPFEADGRIWGALLGACKVHDDPTLGELAAEKVLASRPDEAKTFVLLSNIYAAAGKWTEFANTKRLMKGTGTKKEVGKSWIEVRNQVYTFVAGERLPHMELVYEDVRTMAQHMREAGYVPDLNCSIHELEIEDFDYSSENKPEPQYTL